MACGWRAGCGVREDGRDTPACRKALVKLMRPEGSCCVVDGGLARRGGCAEGVGAAAVLLCEEGANC